MPNNNANIDERIVEMQIDNRQFVDGAEKTMSVLDRLKKALSFKNADEGFADVQSAADKVDFASMAESIDAISDRFTTMGIAGMTVIKNLTDEIVNFVSNTIKGLTIDPVSAGFTQYEEMARQTATIMAATRNEIGKDGLWGTKGGGGQFGTQLEYVEHGLETLTWYADETSATMTDMVTNIGKFTNAGVKFENAVVEMMGVTNWGYQAGAGKAEQARAMYNLSQAVSTGAVKLMDWRSIENAGMATIEFKDTVLETAVELGHLKKTADGTYKTIGKGTEVTAHNFTEALSEGWFTSGVLEKTLMKYGEYSRRLDAVLTDSHMKDFGITAYDVMDAMNKLSDKSQDYSIQKWHEDLKKKMGDETPSIESLTYAYKKLTDSEVELGKRAFLAGQEYKTFGDVIDAVKDAVSSGWMQTFKLIIGDVEQAKEVWTDLGDELNDIFASSAAIRNAVLKFWNDPTLLGDKGKGLTSGRDSLIQAIKNLYNGVRTYIDPIIEAFRNVFKLGDNTKDIAVKLIKLTNSFEKWTEKIALSDKATVGMTNAFTALFQWIKKVLGYLKPAFSIIGSIISYAKRVVELFFESFDNEEGRFDFKYFKEGMGKTFGDVIDKIEAARKKVTDFINTFKEKLSSNTLLSSIAEKLSDIWDYIKSILGGIGDFKVKLPDIAGASEKIEGFWSKIVDWVSGLKVDTQKLKEYFGKIGEILSTLYTAIVGDPKEFKKRVSDLLTNGIEGAREALSKIKLSDVFEGAKTGTMLYIAAQFGKFVSSFGKAAKKFETIPEAITGTFESLSKTIESYGKAQSATTMLKMAGAIALLAASMLALSFIPEDKLASVTVSLAVFFAVLSRIAKNFSKIGDQFSNNKNNLVVKVLPEFAANVIGIAILLGVAVAALVSVSKLTGPQLTTGLIGLFFVLVMVVGSLVAMSHLMKEGVDLKMLGKLISVALVIRAAGSAISKFKDMTPGQILSAGAVMAGIILALVGATALLQGVTLGSGVGSMVALMSMVVVMYAMVPLLLGINKMIEGGKEESLVKSIKILALLGAAVVGFAFIMSLIGNGKGALKGAATLALIGAAFVLFSAALVIAVPPILALFTGLIGLMELIHDRADKLDGTLTTLFALSAIMVIAGAGAVLLGAGMLQAGVGFLAFSAGALLMASALGILTVALVPFAYALTEFCNVIAENGEAIVKVVSVVILGILTAIMASRLKIAYSVIAVILSILVVIHQYGPEIVKIIAVVAEDILKFLLTLVPTLIEFLVLAVVMILDGVANSIRRNKDAIISALENIISAILELAVEVFFRLIGDLFGGLLGMIAGLFGMSEEDKNAAVSEISNFAKSIGESASGTINHAFGDAGSKAESAAQNLIDSFGNTFANGKDDITGKITGVADNVKDTMPEIFSPAGKAGGNEMIDSFVGAATERANSKSSSLDQIGKILSGSVDLKDETQVDGQNYVIGFGNGVNLESPWLQGVMTALANKALTSFEDPLGIHSPSKAAFQDALFFVQGLVNGFGVGEDDAVSASESLANEMQSAVRNALTTISALADDDFSISPTITPVVDMTNVDNAAGSMSDLFNSDATARISGIGRSIADIDRLADSMNRVIENKNNTSKDMYEVNIYTQPDMNPDEIADAVLYKLSDGVIRKGAALG